MKLEVTLRGPVVVVIMVFPSALVSRLLAFESEYLKAEILLSQIPTEVSPEVNGLTGSTLIG